MKKRIVLCADDYGQAPAISQGIINLIKMNRLSATSCMVNTLYWAEHAQWLAPFQQQMDIGLHFNLTEGMPLANEYQRVHGVCFQPLTTVLRLAFMRSLSQSAIEAELHAQIDRFQEVIGFLPKYIDGHQHVHQFPVIRAAVVRVYEQRLRENVYIRLVKEVIHPSDFIKQFKKIVIYVTGAAAFKKLLLKHNIPHNLSFAGIYPFALANQYPFLFTRFLQNSRDKGLIMCHPGLSSSASEDVIAKARYDEYQYFVGDQFVRDCQAHDVEITRFE